MYQHSLLHNDFALLAGLMPAVRASMRRVAGEADGDGRKLLVDKINRIANSAQIRLTSGNLKTVSKDTLDKWLSPSDVSHPPSLLAVIVFCRATNDNSPLQIILQILGLDVMTIEDKKNRDYGKAILEETHMAIATWFCEYTNRSQSRTHLKGASPAEIFNAGRGTGLTKHDIDRLDLLMMQKEIRTITKDGFRLHGKLYWHEVLASRRHEIIVRYDELLSLHSVKVYTTQGEYLCEALDREYYGIAYGIHPAASILGTEAQKLHLVESIELKKGQEKQSSASLKALTENHILPEARIRNAALEVKKQEQLTSHKIEIATTLTTAELEAFEAEKQRRFEAERAKPRYTPCNLRSFRDELERYTYLFDIQYEKNLTLVLEDSAWVEKFEKTTEYTRNYKNRFDGIRNFYELQRATG